LILKDAKELLGSPYMLYIECFSLLYQRQVEQG
jgi:hypothetical protein